MLVGSVFSGIGGIDRGLEEAGFEVAWQCETDKFAREILDRYWPDVKKYYDIRGLLNDLPRRVELLAGGDPCQKHSRARDSRESSHPDMSGYFLALAGRLRSRWVVRENVSASNSIEFAAGLEAIGYGTEIILLNAADFTGQSRKRYIVCGFRDKTRKGNIIFNLQRYKFNIAPNGKKETKINCITAHHKRYNAEETYIYEDKIGLRVLSNEECEMFQGFPRGWTAGLSFTRRRKLIGNAAPPPMFKWIGELIMEMEEQNDKAQTKKM